MGCPAIIKSGKRKNQPCGKQIKGKTGYCYSHQQYSYGISISVAGDVCRETIKTILNKLEKFDVFLSPYGNENATGSLEKKLSLEERLRSFKIPNIIQAVTEIPKIWKRKNGNFNFNKNVTSYGMKHSLEDYRSGCGSDNVYISNGDFIMAMIFGGYSLKFRGENYMGVNCLFNVEKLSERELFSSLLIDEGICRDLALVIMGYAFSEGKKRKS